VRGPACANIEIIDPAYALVGATPTVLGELAVEAGGVSCSVVTYTVYVYSADGSTLLGSSTFEGNDTTSSWQFSIAPTTSPSEVCLVAESSIAPHVVDRAPDEGCENPQQPLILGGGTPATSFR
jgi:hypothetical protein